VSECKRFVNAIIIDSNENANDSPPTMICGKRGSNIVGRGESGAEGSGLADWLTLTHSSSGGCGGSGSAGGVLAAI